MEQTIVEALEKAEPQTHTQVVLGHLEEVEATMEAEQEPELEEVEQATEQEEGPLTYQD